MGEIGYSNFPFNITPGTDVLQQVGFSPRFAIVSNYSPFYIYFPDGLSYCPPWTAGAVIQLQHATQARATWNQSPFGIQDTSLPTGPFSATISFTDDPRLATVGGSPISDPTIQGSTKFRNVSLTATVADQNITQNLGSFVGGGSNFSVLGIGLSYYFDPTIPANPVQIEVHLDSLGSAPLTIYTGITPTIPQVWLPIGPLEANYGNIPGGVRIWYHSFVANEEINVQFLFTAT